MSKVFFSYNLVILFIAVSFQISANPRTTTKAQAKSKNPQTYDTIPEFRFYISKARQEYDASEKKLIQFGDRYLNDHARAAEKLSLAEMLPLQKKNLKSFCQSYKNDVRDYYNLGSKKQIASLKSPVYLDFQKLVLRFCP